MSDPTDHTNTIDLGDDKQQRAYEKGWVDGAAMTAGVLGVDPAPYGLAAGHLPADTLAGQVARILHDRDHGPGSEARLLNRLDAAYTSYLAARGLPAHGTRGTCRRCGAPIEYVHSVDGYHYWRHLGVDVETPHGAVPDGDS